MSRSRQVASAILNNPVLVGTVTILVVVVAVYLSYIAENGIPFVPSYDINVQVADGGELNKNADVKIGGARVGQILTVTPEPASKTWPHPFAQLKLELDTSLRPLPSDTQYQVRLASVLGGQYLELFPGTDRSHTIPDGGTLTLSTNPKQTHDIPFVDLSSALDAFGPKTAAGIRSSLAGLGDAFAGRGTALNDTIGQTSALLPPLDSFLQMLASPQTHLADAIRGLALTSSALAPVRGQLIALLNNAATTAGALDIPTLAQTIDLWPSTEATGTTVFTEAQPVLSDLAKLTVALTPAASYLPTAAAHLETVLHAAPATLMLLTPVSHALENTLDATSALASDKASTQTFQLLGVNDLGTASSSVFVGLGALLSEVSQAQDGCNAAGLWARNLASSESEGNSIGSWLRLASIVDYSQIVQPSGSTPSFDVHINPSPVAKPGRCEAGNEVYTGETLIGSPTQLYSTTTESSTPPPGVYALGQKAGLVP